VLATVVFGDNYLAEKTAMATSEIIALFTPLFETADDEKPQLLLAGPAFNAGRYGLACGAICKAVQAYFALPVVAAMYPENPAVDEYRKDVLIARAGKDVMAMEESVKNMAALACKLLQDEELLPDRDAYIPRGWRKNYFAEKSGAVRAVEMLLQKLAGEPFSTEYVMPVFDRVRPAAAVTDMKSARLALVTSGGIVPRGNPDRIEASSASRFGAYPLHGLSAFGPETHQTAHGGYDPTSANEDPNRILPLDGVRELEAEGAFGSLHNTYYATVGNGTSVANAEEYGSEIAKRLLADGVQAVILTST
jgi:glycine reductase